MKLSLLLLVLGVVGLGTGAASFCRSIGEEDPRVRTTYYPNGKLRSRIEPRDDAAEWQERWRPDGSKESEGELVAGRRQGEWHWWRTDGTLDAERTGTYRDGALETP